MPTCEKCWADSRMRAWNGEDLAYSNLVIERQRAGRVCTPEEQAGPDATECDACHRQTRHQHCGVCMLCGSPPPVPPREPNELVNSVKRPDDGADDLAATTGEQSADDLPNATTRRP